MHQLDGLIQWNLILSKAKHNKNKITNLIRKSTPEGTSDLCYNNSHNGVGVCLYKNVAIGIEWRFDLS